MQGWLPGGTEGLPRMVGGGGRIPRMVGGRLAGGGKMDGLPRMVGGRTQGVIGRRVSLRWWEGGCRGW